MNRFRRQLKKLAACAVIVALCSSRLFMAVACAEEAGVSGNGVTSENDAGNAAVTDGGQTGENRTDEAPADGKDESEKDEAGEKPGNTPADGKQDEKNPTDGSDTSEKNPGETTKPGDNTEQQNPSVSGSDQDGKNPGETVKPSENTGAGKPSVSEGDPSGNNPSGNNPEKPSASGNDTKPSASGNDPSGNNPEKPSASGNNPGEAEKPDETTEPVSGNDPTVSENDPTVSENDPTVSENDPTVSDNDLAEKVYVPLLGISYRMKDGPAGVLMGDQTSTVGVSTAPSYIEPGEDGTPGVSPAVCVWVEMYGETQRIDLADTGMAEIAFPEDFYGTLTLTAQDEQGNTYTETTPTLLVDTGAPTISLAERELADGTKRISAVFKEEGYTATGIAGVRCLIDGVEIETDGYKPENILENCFGQGVISGASLPLEAETAGLHAVKIEAWDYAGNTASYEQEVDLPAKRGPISVAVSQGASLTIAPWSGGEQVYSSDLTFENRSGYDVIATLGYVNLSVNHGDISSKDCSLFLSGDVFEAIALPEGESEKLVKVRIPAKKEDGKTNGTVTMRVRGTISEGSETLWENGDVKLSLRFDYEAAPEE